MRHPTCKKLTEDHRLDATSWPLSDERADLREAPQNPERSTVSTVAALLTG